MASAFQHFSSTMASTFLYGLGEKVLKAFQDLFFMEKCPYCNKEFKNNAGLKGHIRLSHNQEKQPTVLASTLKPQTTREGIREIIQRFIEDQKNNESSKEDIEKLEELLAEDRELTEKQIEEIKRDYHENEIWDQFKDGKWFTKENYEEKIELEKVNLTASHQNEIAQLKGQITDLESKVRNLQHDNTALWETNGDLSDYIGNYLDDAGRLEREKSEKVREALISEREDFDNHCANRIHTINESLLELYNRSEKIKKQETKLDERKEGLDGQEKRIEKRIELQQCLLQEIEQGLQETQLLRGDIERKTEKLKKGWIDLNVTREDLYNIRLGKSLNRRNIPPSNI